jgi:hypothetical protein
MYKCAGEKKWSYDKVESIMKVSRTKELKTETDDRVLDATEHWPSRGRACVGL